MNLFILDKNYNKIGILSNQGASPIAPFFDDKYTQELDTGADTYEFSTIYTPLTQELMEIGNHIIFEFNNEHKLFVIVEVEFSHKNGMHTIDIYAEGIGFELLEKYIDAFEIEGSYSNLLDIILVGTGWEHEVGRKVNDIKKMKYDGEKNILAIIQDSIKEYDGVEVKFEVDYGNNIIKKKVRVYENGGRGSHIGYRFEYGKNVSGITKKEVIADSKDDTVLFTNDNDIGILLEYGVDVAMRSEEIAQLEIGDTHYVIDHDFTPPLLITARIGKLEISFSDPTKNKVTLANYKGATGAISQKTNKGDVTGIAGNVIQQIIMNGDHTHDKLVYGNRTLQYSVEEVTESGVDEGYAYTETYDCQYLGTDNGGALVFVSGRDFIGEDGVEIESTSNRGNLYYTPNSNKKDERYQVFHAGSSFYPAIDGLLHLGDPDHRFYAFFSSAVFCDVIDTPIVECSHVLRAPAVNISEILHLPNGDKITSDTPSLISGGSSGGSSSSDTGTGGVTVAYLDGRLLDYFTKIETASAIEEAKIETYALIKDDYATKEMLFDNIDNLGDYIVREIEEVKDYVDEKISGSSGSGGSSSGGTSGCVFEYVSDGDYYYTDNDIQIERDLYVNGTLHINSGTGMGMGIVDCDTLKVTNIEFTDGTVLPRDLKSRSIDSSTTIEALQEEIRAKDEQIASLEARLARIEAMLDINNDN